MATLNYINIDKSSVPYQFDIQLGNVTYTFDVKYNLQFDYFSIDLYKKSTGQIIKYGEKIVYGVPMFGVTTKKVNGYISVIPRTPDYPSVIILPYDPSGKETSVTFANLGVTTFLYIMVESDLNVN